MDACDKEMVDSVMDSSEESVNSDEEQDKTKEWDDFSDKDSVASSDSAEEEMSIDDGLETLLDEFTDASGDDDWNPEVTPQKKKRSGLSSVSPSPAKSSRSGTPSSVQSGKSKGKVSESKLEEMFIDGLDPLLNRQSSDVSKHLARSFLNGSFQDQSHILYSICPDVRKERRSCVIFFFQS